MERRPLLLTAHVWNASAILKINPLNKLVDFQLKFEILGSSLLTLVVDELSTFIDFSDFGLCTLFSIG